MHFLASILTQFADRRLFLYLFAHNLGDKTEAVFTAMAGSLVNPVGEGEAGEKEERRLCQSSPIKYLFQVRQLSLIPKTCSQAWEHVLGM